MKRVVVTGIGIIAPCGTGKSDYFNNLISGKSFIKRDPEMVSLGFKGTTLSRIEDFNLSSHVDLSTYPEETDSLDPFVHYALVAGEQAILDSGIKIGDNVNSEDIGGIFSSAIGGTPTIVKIFDELTQDSSRFLHEQYHHL